MAKNIRDCVRMYGSEYLATCGLAKYFPTMSMESSVFFVDGINGNDSAGNYGQTPDTPLKTIEAALALVTDNKNDYIFVLDYYQTAAAISVAKRLVHIIGITNKAYAYPWIDPTGDTAAFTIAAGAFGVEIAGFELGGGTNYAAINVTANGSWGTHIHDCNFGSSTIGIAGKYGISITGSGEMIQGRIENCKFGSGLTAGGIYVSSNGANTLRGLVIQNCDFRVPGTGDVGINISTAGDFDEGGIFNNRFRVVAEAGAAVTAASGVHGLLDGNVAVTDNNATITTAEVYRIITGANGLGWGRNYLNGTLLTTEANYIA